MNTPPPAAPTRRQFLRLAGATATLAACGASMARLRAAAPVADAGSAPLGDDFDLSRWLQPVPPQALFEEPGYFVWCGTMVRADDGRCHLYYSRWPSAEGFAAWVTHSEVAHAVADHPLGPYRHVDVALPARGPQFWDGHNTHNPAVFRHGGRYYLYYTGNYGDRQKVTGLNWSHRNHQRVGVAVADRPEGPWRRFDRPLIEPTPGFHDALMGANPSVLARPDGTIQLIYKAVALTKPLPFGGPVVHVVATAPAPTGPFTKRPDPVFTHEGAMFPAEDPFIWREGGRYWAVVKDMRGYFTKAGRSLALMRSDDGLAWRPAAQPLVSRTEFRRADGTVQKLAALERPQLWFDRDEPAVLFCAASIGAEMQSSSTFNVAIPLRRPA
jgi:hypothetical protein